MRLLTHTEYADSFRFLAPRYGRMRRIFYALGVVSSTISAVASTLLAVQHLGLDEAAVEHIARYTLVASTAMHVVAPWGKIAATYAHALSMLSTHLVTHAPIELARLQEVLYVESAFGYISLLNMHLHAHPATSDPHDVDVVVRTPVTSSPRRSSSSAYAGTRSMRDVPDSKPRLVPYEACARLYEVGGARFHRLYVQTDTAHLLMVACHVVLTGLSVGEDIPDTVQLHARIVNAAITATMAIVPLAHVAQSAHKASALCAEHVLTRASTTEAIVKTLYETPVACFRHPLAGIYLRDAERTRA